MKEYHKACGYAWRLDKGIYRDIVHTAFLNYFTSKGKNLFEEGNPVIIKTVKNVWFDYLKSKTFMYNGVNYPKQFIEDFEFSENSLMDEIIFRDTVELIKKSLPDRQAEVFDKLLVGNTIIDIAEQEGKNQNSVRKTVNILRSKLTNPFNGNPTKVVKRIKRKTFETNPSYREEYEMGDGGDFNEYYTLLTSKTKPDEGLLIREGKDDD